MAVGADIVVDLSDNDDDDCVLEAVIYNSNSNHNNYFTYDKIFKENPLLAEVIEKCFNLESTEGMLRVINKTLLEVYKEADPKFKSSSDFETVLKRTLIRLDKDPNHKFSHIKDLCETLRSSKFKKRVQLITLEKKIRPNDRRKLSLKRKSYLERKNKRQKTDIIDLDKYEEIPTINLVQDYINNDSPIVIDDEKQNPNSEENCDCFTEISRAELRLQNNNQTQNQKLGNSVDANKLSGFNNLKENIENLRTNIECTQQNYVAFLICDSVSKINADKLLVPRTNCESNTPESPEKLLVPQKVSNIDLSAEDEPPRIDLEKIKNIELQISRYKEFIAKLDEEEVTEDSLSSPYVKSEKCKEKIVALYKELCTLTGAEAIKRREVTLTVIEGHPSGPVKRLERFLNRNIGSDGNPPFPDFNDVVKCVEIANANDNLGWNKGQVMREASALFTHCGHALQKRRKKREWKDLLSRVKAENCDGDPADADPELLARLEANKRVALKKESDLLERYSTMQNLPQDRKKSKDVQLPPDTDDDVKYDSDESSDECDSLKVNLEENNSFVLTTANTSNSIDISKIVNGYSNQTETKSKFKAIQNVNFVQKDCPPQIVAESITNESIIDEFGVKLIDPREIPNVNANVPTNIAVNFESNVGEVNNKETICVESNFEDDDIQNNVSNVTSQSFETNVEENYGKCWPKARRYRHAVKGLKDVIDPLSPVPTQRKKELVIAQGELVIV
ncbi:jg18081 [Pararge aegeria aegeria]|uniref:Death domain-associated protein 6 n=1 Tax=Pararge aegeria aegeria TaxID=348720 RepID=A0A8S4RRB4_9NEOP|nr:jg18081 [Pararge aegeria aegeria]